MLILTRREGEIICVGKDIRIKVCRINGNQVSIAVMAPRSMHIVREELLTGYVVKRPPKEY
jgi:carbon storage regulator